MTTIRIQTPATVYTAIATGPALIELMEPGRVRIVVSPSQPVDAYTAYHLLQYPAGRFVYSGDETVWAQSDKVGEDPYLVVTDDKSSQLLVQGKVFRVSGKISGLTAYGFTNHLIKVPFEVFPRFHRLRVNAGGGDVDMITYEAPTITDDGTKVPALNLNRNSAVEADMEIWIGPTFSAPGSSIDTQWIPPTLAGIGQRLDDGVSVISDVDWILKDNTLYLVQLVNNSPIPISLWFEYLWVEPS